MCVFILCEFSIKKNVTSKVRLFISWLYHNCFCKTKIYNNTLSILDAKPQNFLINCNAPFLCFIYTCDFAHRTI